MSESEKEALRKLIMLISDLRAKDEERYAAHVNFMNETIKMIKAIESQMNKHWSTVLDSLSKLNKNINANLESLLSGINPQGLKETSQSLNEIMSTLNRNVSALNLEKIVSELKILQSGTYQVAAIAPAAAQQQTGPEQITVGAGLKPSGLKAPGGVVTTLSTPTSEGEGEWVDPHEAAKKKKEKDDEPHLLKPSDLWK